MHKMINHKISTLAKDAGYDVPSNWRYLTSDKKGEPIFDKTPMEWNRYGRFSVVTTVGELVNWLHEKEGIWINFEKTGVSGVNFRYTILKEIGDEPDLYVIGGGTAASPEALYNKALAVVLNKVISVNKEAKELLTKIEEE